MSELSEVLGSLMISLVHARRMADEETAAVAEYYKDHPLLEGMSLPRVRVPELTIDMPITIDSHSIAKEATFDTPGNIHKALMSQLRDSLEDEELLSRTQSFQSIFDAEARKALERVIDQHKSESIRVSKEALVRSIDDALQTSLKKADLHAEIPHEKKSSIIQAIRHKVSSIAIKNQSRPMSMKTSAVTSHVKESATAYSSVNLSITLREEGLEWASSKNDKGATKNRLMPE